jgi:hypothetical protein
MDLMEKAVVAWQKSLELDPAQEKVKVKLEGVRSQHLIN